MCISVGNGFQGWLGPILGATNVMGVSKLGVTKMVGVSKLGVTNDGGWVWLNWV